MFLRQTLKYPLCGSKADGAPCLETGSGTVTKLLPTKIVRLRCWSRRNLDGLVRNEVLSANLRIVYFTATDEMSRTDFPTTNEAVAEYDSGVVTEMCLQWKVSQQNKNFD